MGDLYGCAGLFCGGDDMRHIKHTFTQFKKEAIMKGV